MSITTSYFNYFTEDIIFDPNFEFESLTDEQRKEMESEFRSRWIAAADEALKPHGLEIFANGEVIGAPGLDIDREEITEILGNVDADEDNSLFEKWAEINAN